MWNFRVGGYNGTITGPSNVTATSQPGMHSFIAVVRLPWQTRNTRFPLCSHGRLCSIEEKIVHLGMSCIRLSFNDFSFIHSDILQSAEVLELRHVEP